MEHLFVDCAWLVGENKECWELPINWHKTDYDDSSWDESNWVDG